MYWINVKGHRPLISSGTKHCRSSRKRWSGRCRESESWKKSEAGRRVFTISKRLYINSPRTWACHMGRISHQQLDRYCVVSYVCMYVYLSIYFSIYLRCSIWLNSINQKLRSNFIRMAIRKINSRCKIKISLINDQLNWLIFSICTDRIV